MAVYNGNKDVAELLIAIGADVNAKDSTGGVPLAYASSLDLVKLLIDKGADVHALDNSGNTLLFSGRHLQTDKAAIYKLLISKGVDINQQNKYGLTAFSNADFTYNLDVAELFLTSGAKFSARDSGNALIAAARQGDVKLAKLLIEKGADINAKDYNGDCALAHAASKGHVDVAELLIAQGVNINAINNHDDTPLHSAAYGGNKYIAELLIAKGANVNAKDSFGHTPLYIAENNRHQEVVELLLASGADANAKENHGTTALYIASQQGHNDVVQMHTPEDTPINVPRRTRYISPRVEELRFAVYVESFRLKVERIGTLNFPIEAKQNNIYGSLQLSVSINPNGSLESVAITHSSGQPILDEAALRIIRLAAPFQPFPENIRRDTDILNITGTWEFLPPEKTSDERGGIVNFGI